MCEGIEASKISSDSSDSINNMKTNEVTYSSENYHSNKDFDENHSRAKQLLDEESSASSSAVKKIDNKIVIPIMAVLLLLTIKKRIVDKIEFEFYVKQFFLF